MRSPLLTLRSIRRSVTLLALPVLTVLLLALPAAAPLQAQDQDFSDVEIQTVLVAQGVWMLVGAGGNIGVSAGEDGVFLIDDQYAPLTEKIRTAVAKLSPKPIRFVLNTHWHGDHTGGNEHLGEAGVLIVANDNVRKRMSSEQFLKAMNRKVPPSPEIALPVVTYSEDVTFYLNGDTIHAIHVAPAHTDGDSIVYFEKADVIHMGDVFFESGYPFVDLSSGGSVQGVIDGVNRALEMIGPNTKVIPGHGKLSDRAGLIAYRDMLRTIVGRVAEAKAAGKSLEEIQSAKPTAELDERWGGGFIDADRIVATIFESLGKKGG
jgi:glyoxylase-like metal-dependent hydrolase (beta-lactamase superfamily II)